MPPLFLSLFIKAHLTTWHTFNTYALNIRIKLKDDHGI